MTRDEVITKLLTDFLEHKTGCDLIIFEGGKCNCGLNSLLALLSQPACSKCKGTGQVGEEEELYGRSVGWKECPKCKGTGIQPAEPSELAEIEEFIKCFGRVLDVYEAGAITIEDKVIQQQALVPVEWSRQALKKLSRLAAEVERLKKCESDLRKIYEEKLVAVKEANKCFRYFGGKLMLVALQKGDEDG